MTFLLSCHSQMDGNGNVSGIFVHNNVSADHWIPVAAAQRSVTSVICHIFFYKLWQICLYFLCLGHVYFGVFQNTLNLRSMWRQRQFSYHWIQGFHVVLFNVQVNLQNDFVMSNCSTTINLHLHIMAGELIGYLSQCLNWQFVADFLVNGPTSAKFNNKRCL